MSEIQRSIARSLQHQTSSGQARRALIHAPVGGWNTRDPLASMEPQFALHLENWFPTLGRIETRRGYLEYCDTGGDDEIRTLLPHQSGSLNRLYAITDSRLYDATNPDSVSTLISSGVTDGRWRSAIANGHCILVNGVDDPLRIDATGAPVAHGFTGTNLTPRLLTQVAAHRNRLFFAEKDSTRLWYGGLNNVTGELKSFDVGLVNEEGGNIVAIGSLPVDTGVGVDNLLAIFMTRGHVLVYAGPDPSSASTWQISGIYHLGRVVGPTPLVKLGGDLIAITADGYIPLLQFIKAGRQAHQLAISDLIAPTVTAEIRDHANDDGWRAILHSPSNWLLFNIPQNDGLFIQHVQNVQTGAWCLFRGMNGECWATWKDRIYFGTPDGKIMQADVGGTDDGGSIRSVARLAYNYLGSPYDKLFHRIRAHLESAEGASSAALGASVDFSHVTPDLAGADLTPVGTPWGQGVWGEFTWSRGVSRDSSWRAVGQNGSCISIHVATNTSGPPISLAAADVLYDSISGALAAST